MDTESKGLMPGIHTVWYTILVAAAAVYGLELFKDIIAIISLNSGFVPGVLDGPNGWRVMVALLLEAAVFALLALAAKRVYERSMQGWYFAFASAGAGADLFCLQYCSP